VDLPKGEKLYIDCRIYNYSFLPVSNVKVRFYYAPYNPQPGHTSEGTPVEIGTTSIDRIPGWTQAGDPNWAWAKVLWDTSNISLPSSTDTYMVRVRIDPDDTIDEVHDDADPAENNTGRYEVALVDSADLELSDLSGSSVSSGGVRTSEVLSSCDLAIVADSLSVARSRVSADEPVTVNASVLLSKASRKRSLVLVGFFDGKPGAGGKLFDIRRIPLMSPDIPYAVQATFRSSTAGQHRLYAMVMGEPGNRLSGETASIPVYVSTGNGGGSGGCDAAGSAAPALGLLVLMPLLARRKK
jgi:Synergist-CTERM protein sorting domain-containing protein